MKLLDFTVYFSILVGMLIAYIEDDNVKAITLIRSAFYVILLIEILILTLMIIISYRKLKRF